MVERWQEEHVMPASLVRAMLLAEGVADSAALSAHEAVVAAALAEVSRHVKERHSNEKKAKTIFKRLHSDVLKRYDEGAQLTDLSDGGRFNCVTGTALFYLAARQHGVPVRLHVTPIHVYAVADPAGSAVRVEMTDPKKGFDFDDERDDVIEHLLAYKMITPDELELEGEEAIYRAFIQNEWVIEPEALVGIVYNNEAALHLADEEYVLALHAYEKALLIEPERDEYKQAHAGMLALMSIFLNDDLDQASAHLHHALAVRHGDETFAEVAVSLVGWLAERHVENRTFGPVLETLTLTRQHLPQDDETTRVLQEIEGRVHHDWAMSLTRRGDYTAALEKSRHAYDLLGEENLIREGYVAVACQHAIRLAEAGEVDAARAEIESLLELAGEFPIIGDTYGRLVAHAVLSGPDPLYRDDPEAAKEMVLRALEIAPDMVALSSSMAAIYHERAMAEVRADNYDAAAELAEEGLQYAPESRQLREALDLIKEAQ